MKNMFKTRKQRKGFSLVELVVVILIIAILAVAVFAGGSAVIKKSQVSRTTSDLHNSPWLLRHSSTKPRALPIWAATRT